MSGKTEWVDRGVRKKKREPDCGVLQADTERLAFLLSSGTADGHLKQQPHDQIYALSYRQPPCGQALSSLSHPFPRRHLSGLCHVPSAESGADGRGG